MKVQQTVTLTIEWEYNNLDDERGLALWRWENIINPKEGVEAGEIAYTPIISIEAGPIIKPNDVIEAFE
jgi:hypothetical protein